MKAILIDSYRHGNKIILWLKTLGNSNIRIEKNFRHYLYLECCELAESILRKYNVPNRIVEKKTYKGEIKKVYEIAIKKISCFERIVRRIEREARHRINLYDADIPPEQMFLYKSNLKPFFYVEVYNNKILSLDQEAAVLMDKMDIEIIPSRDIRADKNAAVETILTNGKEITGSEETILKRFTELFISEDPDIILMENAFAKLPYLVRRLEAYRLKCPFHRWDYTKIESKGSKSFFSYGRVVHREYAIRLKGRFLIDSGTMVGSECCLKAITELSSISGTRFQQVASRSFGAVFQSALIREMVRRDCLVPFKEKPVDQPVTLYTLLKFDRVGHTFDSITGLHHDVAEIDFSSLFPWIIYNYNISTENIQGGEPPYQKVPGLPLKISLRRKGIVPIAIKPFLDRRMHYKANPTSLNKAKSVGLKWVLVTSYGYLRFREFKLGIATSHMTIGAFAREIMIKAKMICEEEGFKIVHGIVDSLYIKKKDINEIEVREICRAIELETGIPVSFEGIYRWIVFLPSINDYHRPIPTHYYGVFLNGDIKVRGLEARQRGAPKIVKQFQMEVLRLIGQCNTKKEIIEMFPYLCQLLRKTIFMLPMQEAGMLSSSIVISKTDYKNDVPQKIVLDLLNRKNVSMQPGQKMYFIYSEKGIVLPEDYRGKPDIEHYKKLLVRALFVVLQPFGFTRKEINELADYEKQSKLHEYLEKPDKINNQIMSLSLQA
ncbi:hypothetical protein JW930_02845 [Candidatus Woesearchaeota archaeon]|nr:hypothetical protein [Candidatus Woesearchaeota archaeon]